ncbi:MAG: GH92 family glycosyl hydrolase [Kiritimatiellia bacterium]
MNMKLFVAALSLTGALSVSGAERALVDWVNTEIGTISHLLVPCFRTVQLPNAMLRFLPPYRDYTQDKVGPLKLQNPGHRNPGVFDCYPYSGAEKDLFAKWRATWDQEHATPYSYDITFDSCGVRFALVPTERCALATFSFPTLPLEPSGNTQSMGASARGPRVNAVVFAADEVETTEAGTVRLKDTFRGRDNQAPVWLSGEFDAKPARIVREGKQVAFVFDQPVVKFRYGVSTIGFDQAARNLAAEVKGWDPASLAAAGRKVWNEKLGKIEVEGGTDDQKTVFYSSLWRTYERMVNCTEDGKYRGWDGQVHETEGVDYYTDDWIWDSYRAHHPLMVILDPVRCGGHGARNYFTENNAWTYIWDVQHNLPHLRELLGGPEGMAQRLDEMLNTGVGDRVHYVSAMPDGSTGMMGNFTMANEPSFHIPYIYNYAGQPHKTQKFVRKTLDAWFRNDKMGMCGDEDGGGMTAYAVFSMMGFYPVTPGLPEYQIGSPVFTKVTIHLSNGKDFILSAPKASKDAKYWDVATLGGKPVAGTVLRHEDILAGKTLTLEMHE